MICPSCNSDFSPRRSDQSYCAPECRPNKNANAKRNAAPLTFIGVDGEGVTHADGTHDYVLLSVGDRSLHNRGARLTFLEIVDFLWDCFQDNPKACFVGYYLKYDFTHWVRDLPEERAYRLVTEEGRKSRTPKTGRMGPFPVQWQGWEFDFLAMKRFSLRKRRADGKGAWLHINDAGPFFQSSFLKAINPASWPDPICSREIFARIEQGKKERASAQFDETMIAYNIAENAVLADLCARLNEGFQHMGFRLQKRNFYGPGAVASLWLKKMKAKKPEGRDVALENALRASYYGGRFEIMAHGPVGTLYEYDINSAYPHEIEQLPSEGGTWRHLTGAAWRKKSAGGASHVLCHIAYSAKDKWIGGLPHRHAKGKRIDFPLDGRGWYWLREIEAAQQAIEGFKYEMIEAWAYTPSDGIKPFADIRALYEFRLEAGKNTPAGKAAKLAYNSPYGKMAQSIGQAPFANAFYASLITSGTRTKILEAIASHPRKSEGVAMIATDGIYFFSPHPSLDIDAQALGKWDEATKKGMTLFMPGFYWWAGSGLRSRGCSADGFAKIRDHVAQAWQKALVSRGTIKTWPAFSVDQVFGFVTPALALARGKWETCGALERPDKNFTSDPSNKRASARVVGGIIRSKPYKGDRTSESVAYDKSFGQDLKDEAIADLALTNAENFDMILRDEFMG